MHAGRDAPPSPASPRCNRGAYPARRRASGCRRRSPATAPASCSRSRRDPSGLQFTRPTATARKMRQERDSACADDQARSRTRPGGAVRVTRVREPRAPALAWRHAMSAAHIAAYGACGYGRNCRGAIAGDKSPQRVPGVSGASFADASDAGEPSVRLQEKDLCYFSEIQGADKSRRVACGDGRTALMRSAWPAAFGLCGVRRCRSAVQCGSVCR